MRRPRPPVFLAPDRYRRRRLMDGARMLPMVGAFLLFLPILWRPAGDGHETAVESVYLFGVWAALIAVAWLLSGPLLAADNDPVADLDDDPKDGGEGGG